MEKIGVDSIASAELTMVSGMDSALKVGGRFEYELVRRGRVIDKWVGLNTVTNEGRNYLLDIAFGGGAVEAAWYVGIYTATAGAFADLTGAMIGGANLTEFTSYTGNRPLYDGVRTSYTWTNVATKASFPITHAGTIKGAFVASDDTGVASQLLCINAFATGDRIVAPADTLNVTYIFGMQNV